MLLSTTVHRDRPREFCQSSSRDIQWRDFEKQIPKVLLRRHFCTRRTTHHTKAEKICFPPWFLPREELPPRLPARRPRLFEADTKSSSSEEKL